MLDFFQKGGSGKWLLIIGIIAIVIYFIYKHKHNNI